MIEIERKYLVKSNQFMNEYFTKSAICQGYICSKPERTVRVRIKNTQGYITIKGINADDSISRFEWEKEIPLNEAHALLKLCEKGVIKKTRYNIKAGEHVVEVDVFDDENEGLIIAEIELENENEVINKPDWLGDEVTHDIRYYNAYLSKNPFTKW